MGKPITNRGIKPAGDGFPNELEEQHGAKLALSPVVEEMGRLLSGFADCICCGRGNRYQSADAWMNQPLNIFQPRSTATLEDLLEKSSRAREAVWQQLGSLEPLVLSHLVSPTLSGGPKWPALRQAFRLVRRPNGNIILASDGLSDPFDDITLGTYTVAAVPALIKAVVSDWKNVQMPQKGLPMPALVKE